MNQRRCVAALTLSLVLAGCSTASSPPKHEMPAAPLVKILSNGLGEADRYAFYHTSEGSELFPKVLLESSYARDTNEPFLDTLEDYGLIRDGQPKAGNHESLGYIGLTVRRSEAGVDLVGVNCAACHVGQIESPKGKKIRIDGAPNMFDIMAFFNAIPKMTVHDAELLDDIRHEMESNWFRNALHPVVFAGYVDDYLNHLSQLVPLSNGTPPMAGRADAFGAARAVFFGDAQPLTAPTSFPSMWGFRQEAWFHWNANTNSAIERNLGQAIGLGASVDQTKKADCSSSIDIEALGNMESLAYKILPPEWPEEDLGAIDQDKAKAGKVIYMKECAGCHDKYGSSPNGPGFPRRDNMLFSVDEVGTDPYEALNSLVDVDVDTNMCDKVVPHKSHMVRMHFGEAHNIMLEHVKAVAIAKFKAEHPDKAAEIDDWGDHRINPQFKDRLFDPPCDPKKPRDCPIYPAKSLVGIWASPPYLHNGSVPNMMTLLTPPSQRPDHFLVGQRRYDPVNMGYDQNDTAGKGRTLNLKDAAGNFLPGDSNAGHDYGTKRSAAEKLQLLEYLKSLKP